MCLVSVDKFVNIARRCLWRRIGTIFLWR